MTLARILSNAGTPKMEKATPAAMHENSALALAMQQLHDAAITYDQRAMTAATKRDTGYWRGCAAAHRHVISVLAQVKL